MPSLLRGFENRDLRAIRTEIVCTRGLQLYLRREQNLLHAHLDFLVLCEATSLRNQHFYSPVINYRAKTGLATERYSFCIKRHAGTK